MDDPLAHRGVPQQATDAEALSEQSKIRPKKITLYGNFGRGNLGNEITLYGVVHAFRALGPVVAINCVCMDPEAVAIAHNINCVPLSREFFQNWKPRNTFTRMLRLLVIGVPTELYRWFDALVTLRDTDILLVPGTGLLTDAYGLKGWGPVGMFRWVLAAKVRGCKVIFVSVGAGPAYTRAGRWLIKSALTLAEFRSYRDSESKDYLRSIGVDVSHDEVCPDLAFGVADEIKPTSTSTNHLRRVVGIGVMLYHGPLSSGKRPDLTYASHLEQLSLFVEWLMTREYDVRLLIGDVGDRSVVSDFKALLKQRLGNYDENRIIDEPISTVQDLLAQIAQTDVVVATRFHNALLSLALNKPVLSISFHPKCTSLMKDMGLLEYCQDIHQLNAENLIEQFCRLEKNAESLKQMIAEKVAERRKAVEEQYALIFHYLPVAGPPASSSQISSKESFRVPAEARK